MDNYSNIRKTCRNAGIVFVFSLCTAKAHAETAEHIVQTLTPLGAETLQELRGGFVEADGLKISFMLANATRIDGELQNQTLLKIPNLNADIATAIRDGAFLSVIQSGPGNAIDQNALHNATGFVDIIQNSLNNTVIDHTRLLNIEMHGVSSLRALDTSSTLNRQILESLF